MATPQKRKKNFELLGTQFKLITAVEKNLKLKFEIAKGFGIDAIMADYNVLTASLYH
jgi:hypothetical protein